MFVWRKRASAVWLAANEAALGEVAGRRLAIISRPGRKNAIAEIAASRQRDLEKIRTRFGGKVEMLSRDWLAIFSQAQTTKPIKIGKRLVIVSSSMSTSTSKNKTPLLVIPAGSAFGTGEHGTTAMSLRLLEQTTRSWGAHAPRVPFSAPRRKFFPESIARGAQRSTRGRVRSPEKNWALLDLGTGTGILALAAKKLGAARVIAIDHDPIAIATAKANARRNKIDNIDFRVADLRRWKFPRKVDIVTANLFSELLIEILPKLKHAQCLILSGILREQAAQLDRALKGNGIAIVETRQRGKWIALACHPER
jgi:ribosomal protein L11 methyltransferase